MAKAVDIKDGILFVRTRHYDNVKMVVVRHQEKPEKRFYKANEGDLISREALKEKLKERYYNGGLDIVTAIELIDNAPIIKFTLLPADESKEEAYMRGYKHGKIEGILKSRTRQQGEWIYNDKLNMFYCKDCGLLEPFTKEEVEEGVKLPNFCENCGANMRKGGKNGSDKQNTIDN